MAAGIAVLGLDALPYWQLRVLREWGGAPTITGGVWRRLEAVPPITPASWPSIMGGVNPGKHGLFSFFAHDRETGESRLVSAVDLEHPRVHEMLSYEGVPSIMVNPIPDYPPLPARRAVVVSNLFFTPRPYSSPGGLHERYFDGLWPPGRSPDYYARYFEALEAMLEDLLRDPPPLAWVNVNFPDGVYHKYPEAIGDPGRASRAWRAAERVARLLKEAYGNLVVVSDHGFRVHRYRVNVNDILYRHGLAVPARGEEEASVVEEHARERGEETRRLVLPSWAYTLVGRLGLEPLARKLFYNAVQPLYRRLTGKTLVVRAGRSVDPRASRAYMPFGGAYGVYTRGAAPEEVAALLNRYRGLRAAPASEYYRGPYARRGPDVVVLGDHEAGYDLGPARIMGSLYTRTRFPSHDPWGVLVLDLEDDVLDAGALPETLPNHAVAPLIQCALGAPASSQADSLDLARRACRRPLQARDYAGKFRLAKRLALRLAGGARG